MYLGRFAFSRSLSIFTNYFFFTLLGETKECTEFAKQFLERRSKQRMQQRQQNAHIDDMCSPAPAINPQANNSSDFQEVKVSRRGR